MYIYYISNLYACFLTIITIISVNDLRLSVSSVNFICYKVLASKPYLAIDSYPIQKEEIFGKIKMLPPTFWATLKTLNDACRNANIICFTYNIVHYDRIKVVHLHDTFECLFQRNFVALDTWLNGRLKK